MLSYKAPFLEAGNLTIFKDDSNPDVFYYVCVQPSIMLDENGMSKVEAYAILPESGVGIEADSIMEASLMMDVNLAPTAEDLAFAEKQIQEKLGTKPKMLVPAPIHSGKVRLIVAAAGNEPDPKKWFVTSEVKPSIFGSNIASLVVRAVGQDGKLLIAALDSDVIAASIHYELEMLGVAPVFKATMSVNWSKVYHHFEKFEKANFIFYSDEVSDAVDRLQETSAIEIMIEELDPVVKSEALKGILNELKSEVLKKLFQPAASPLSAANKLEDRIANGVSRVVSAIHPGVHHIRRNIDETQLSITTVTLNQRNVKTYPFYPQALLSSMIRASGGIKDKIKWIKLDEIPFIDQKVEIRLSADTFKNSNIKSVIVECRVFDETANEVTVQRSIAFDSDDALNNSLNFTREKDKTYRYDYRVTMFMTTESNKLPGKLEIDWNSERSPFIYFNAAEYFETREITISIDDSSIFEHAHLIQADLKVLDETDLTQILARTFLFNATNKEQKVLSVVTNKTIPVQFDLALTYFISASKEHRSTFTHIDSAFFFVPNIFENKWSVDLICNADWEKSDKVVLETSIRDAERTEPIFNKFTFTKELNETKLIIATSLDTPRQAFEYRVTCLSSVDSNVVQGPWKNHEGPILVVNDKVQSERIIRATLTRAPNFETMEIKQVSIEFVYDDKDNNIHIESEKLPFRMVGDTVEFKHPMPNFNHKEFSYRKRVRGLGGESYNSGWLINSKEKLEIEIPNNIW